MSDDGYRDLPLFHGPHIPRIRFERALESLDLGRAVADAPPPWRQAVEDLAAEVERAGGPGRAAPERLARFRHDGWPAPLERAWQALMGLALDGRKVPGAYGGELAAAYLLRGGRRDRARASLDRHLDHQPRDVRAWELLTQFEPLRGAARCGFHGGAVLEGRRRAPEPARP